MSKLNETRQDRLLFIEGIKGIAAIVVVVFHFLSAVYPPLINGQSAVRPESKWLLSIGASPLNILYDGNLSVAFFFILSGFGLSYNFFKNNTISNKMFFDRYKRLTPQILTSVILVYLSLKLSLNYSHQLAELTKSNWLASFYNYKISFIEMLSEGLYGSLIFGRCKYNPTLWTLKFFFWGSFLIFAVLHTIKDYSYKTRNKIYILFFLMLFNSHYLSFVVGIAICDAYINLNKKRMEMAILLPILLIGIFLASYPAEFPPKGTIYEFISYVPWTQGYSVAMFWHIVGGGIIIFAVCFIPFLQKIFAWKPFVFIGRISYEIYVIGFILQNILFTKIFLSFNSSRGWYGKSFVISTLLVLFLIILCAEMLRYLISHIKHWLHNI